MLKSIWIQLWNRKRSNIWIIIELLLVFCLTWYIADYFFVYHYNKHIPDYSNIDHTWSVGIGEYTTARYWKKEADPEYQEEYGSGEIKEANYRRILQAIKDYPGVEVVGVSMSSHAASYQGGGVFYNAADTTISADAIIQPVDLESDYFRVFSLSKDKGKTPVSVQDYDWTNRVVISELVAKSLFPDNPSAIGERIQQAEHGELTVTGIIDDIKNYSYNRPKPVIYTPFRLDSTNLDRVGIDIRINPSISESRFKEEFEKDMTNTMRVGNFYFGHISSNQEIEKEYEVRHGVKKNIDIRTYLMAFFLINILLCLLGTFWYRINVRKEEIGIRKAVGATNKNILVSLVLEGLCLLTITFIPAMIIEYQFVQADLIQTLGKGGANTAVYLPDRTLLRFLITNGITWLIMAVVVVGATLLPAISASKVVPVEALRDE